MMGGMKLAVPKSVRSERAAPGAAAMRKTARALDGEIAAALEAGEMKQKIGRLKEKLTDWDGQMSAAGVSPGGCADLLAMALLMAFCERDAAEA